MRAASLLSLAVLLCAANASAAQSPAQCSLVVDGKQVWTGKCCVTTKPSEFGPGQEINAESWKACVYDRKHPKNAHAPTFQQVCYGPWFNAYSDPDAKGGWSAYWTLEDACHGGENFPASRDGNAVQGDKFRFEWTPPR